MKFRELKNINDHIQYHVNPSIFRYLSHLRVFFYLFLQSIHIIFPLLYIFRIDVKYVQKYFHVRQIWVHICHSTKPSIRKNSAAMSAAKFGNQNIVLMYINDLMKKKLLEHFHAIIVIESMEIHYILLFSCVW